MLRNTKDLEEFVLGAKDGVIGNIRDFYFDDAERVIRYLIVDTGSWLSSRKVLISPMAIGKPEWWGERTLPVDLTRAQVEASPHTDTEQPVSRQQEGVILVHYGYPYYWGGMGLWGGGLYPPTPWCPGSSVSGRPHLRLASRTALIAKQKRTATRMTPIYAAATK